MPFEITPEPTPEERDAVVRALAALNGDVCAPDAWWQAGIREAVGEESEES